MSNKMHRPGEHFNEEYDYTGEFRFPNGSTESFVDIMGGVCKGIPAKDNHGLRWILEKRDGPKGKHTVEYWDGRKIYMYSFIGDIDWNRLEADLRKANAIEALVYSVKMADVVHLSHNRNYWDKNDLLLGDAALHYYRGWAIANKERDSITEGWITESITVEQAHNALYKEIQEKYLGLGELLKKLQ